MRHITIFDYETATKKKTTQYRVRRRHSTFPEAYKGFKGFLSRVTTA